MNLPLQILVILACLLGTGLFAGLETGIISINRLRLMHMVRQGVPGASILQRFLEKPDSLLGTTLVGTNICMVTASVAAASLSSRFLNHWGSLISSIVMTLIILIACEYLPKAWFQSAPARRTRPFAPFLQASGWILYPISCTIMFLARLLFPAPSKEKTHKVPLVTREELKHLARETEQSGELTSSERRMLHAAFELTHKTCADIMVPMDRTVSIHENDAVQTILDAALRGNVSRLPIRSESADAPIGFLHVLDVLLDSGNENKTAKSYLRPVQLLEGATPLDEVLPRMRLARQPAAFVTDEKGSMVGWLSVEDVLDELIGTI